jgi:hypothetical protein
MARQWMTPEGFVIDEDGEDEYMLSVGFVMNEDQAAAVGTNPKGPLGHPLHGPLAGPVAA